MGRHGPLRRTTDSCLEIQSVGRDITEQRNSELALRASEASYRALVETQTEFVLRLLPDGRLTFVNEAYCRYVNTSREEMLRSGWNDLEMVAPEDRATYEKHLRALTPEHPTAAIEVRAILPDGSERWEAWVDTGIFDRDGGIAEIQSVGRDVTERKRAELALRESEARYRALVETQTEFVLRQLPEGRLTFVNEAYCRYVGKSRDELLSELVQWPRHDDAGRSAASSKNICGSLTPDHPTSSMETRAVLPDGSERWEWWVDTRRLRCQGQAGRVAVDRARRHGTKTERDGAARERDALSGRRRRSERIHPARAPQRVRSPSSMMRIADIGGSSREQMLGGFNDVYHYPPEQQATIHAAWASALPRTFLPASTS